MRKKFEPAYKAKVALESLRGEKTMAQLSSEYEVHVNQIGQWRQELIKRSADLFSNPNTGASKRQEELTDKLHRTIGELKVENDWLKKKLSHLA